MNKPYQYSYSVRSFFYEVVSLDMKGNEIPGTKTRDYTEKFFITKVIKNTSTEKYILKDVFMKKQASYEEVTWFFRTEKEAWENRDSEFTKMINDRAYYRMMNTELKGES